MTVGSVLVTGKANMSGVSRELGRTASELDAVGQRAVPAARRLEQVAVESDRTARSVSHTAVQIVEVTAAIVSLTEAAYKAYRAFSKFKEGVIDLIGWMNRLAGVASTVGTALTGWLTVPIGGLQVAGIKAAMGMERLTAGLKAVLPPGADLRGELDELRKTAKLPGLGFEEAVRGSIRLQAAGTSAEQARGLIEGFGNALVTVGAGKEDLDGVIVAMSQIASKGKVSAEEINQMAERLPQIRQLMSKAFGTSDTQELQDMGMKPEQFFAGLNEELKKMPKATGGAINSVENFQDVFKTFLVTIGQPLLPLVVGVFQALSGVISAVTAVFSALPEPVQLVVTLMFTLIAAVGPLLLLLAALAKTAAAVWTARAILDGARFALTLVTNANAAGAASLATRAYAATAAFLGNVFPLVTARLSGLTAALGLSTLAQRASAISTTVVTAAQNLYAAATVRAGVFTSRLTAFLGANAIAQRAVAAGALTSAGALRFLGVASAGASKAIAFLTFGLIRFGAAAGAAGAAGKAGLLVKTIGMLVKVSRVILGGVTVMGQAMLAFLVTPAGLVVAAIVAVLLILYIFRDKLNDTTHPIGKLMAAIKRLGEVVLGVFALIIGLALYPFIRAFEQLRDTVIPAVGRLMRGIGSGIKKGWDAIETIMQSRPVRAFMEPLEKLNNRIDRWVRGVGSRLVNGIVDVLDRSGGKVGDAVGRLLDNAFLDGEHYAERNEIEANFVAGGELLPFDFEATKTDAERYMRALATMTRGTAEYGEVAARLTDIQEDLNYRLSVIPSDERLDETAVSYREVNHQISEALKGEKATKAEINAAANATASMAEEMRQFNRLAQIGARDTSELPSELSSAVSRADSLIGRMRQLRDDMAKGTAPAGVNALLASLGQQLAETDRMIEIHARNWHDSIQRAFRAGLPSADQGTEGFRNAEEAIQTATSKVVAFESALRNATAETRSGLTAGLARANKELQDAQVIFDQGLGRVQAGDVFGFIGDIPAAVEKEINKVSRLPVNLPVVNLNGIAAVDLALDEDFKSASDRLNTMLGSINATIAGLQTAGVDVPETLLDARDRINQGIAELFAKMHPEEVPSFAKFAKDWFHENVPPPGVKSWQDFEQAVFDSAGELRLLAAQTTVQFRHLGLTAQQAANMFGQAALDAASQLLPLGVVSSFIAGIMNTLGPAFEALLVPVTIVGEAFGKALAPILKALFPVFKGLAIAATFVGEIFFRVAGAITLAVGGLVRGLGRLINKLPGSLGNPLIAIGQALVDQGRGFQEGATELSRARDELRNLSFEDAMERVSTSADRVAESLSNLPTIFDVTLRRMQAARGGSTTTEAPRLVTSSTVATPTPAQAGDTIQLTIQEGAIQVSGVSNPQEAGAAAVNEVIRQLNTPGQSRLKIAVQRAASAA